MRIPATNRLQARPVWRRHLRRTHMNISPLPPPTEEECEDAIQVLKLSKGVLWDSLAKEAFRIFEEAGR